VAAAVNSLALSPALPPALSPATRPVYWHIDHVWLMYVALAVALAVLAHGLYRRARVWRALGRPHAPGGTPGERLRHLWRHAGLHQRLLRDHAAGAMHALILWGMVLLLAGTVVVMLHVDFGLPLMQGWFYLLFQKLALNLAGVALASGLVVALVRRYLLRVPRLAVDGGRRADLSDLLSPLWLLVIVAEGFGLQALLIAGTGDPHAAWSPVGNALSLPLRALPQQTLVSAYKMLWWTHLLTVLGWIAWLPHGKLLHVFLAPANVALGTLGPRPRTPAPIDFEAADRLGVARLTDLSWKDMLDLDACTWCGRCEAACPAFAAGQPLSPRGFILDLRDHVRARAPALLAVAADSSAPRSEAPDLVGLAVAPETVWACLTCGACVRECPVLIEPVPKIIDLRRHLVMEKGEAPATLQDTLRTLENRGHPYQGVSAGRGDWMKGLDIARADDGDFEVLYWAGCTAAFDPRAQKVARSLVQLLQTAGVRVAVLGEAEGCCGDPARRMGHEFLYDQFARANIEQLEAAGVHTIVTACPHCFNALGHEYRDFGAAFTVQHHSQFLRTLVDEGRLALAAADAGTVTYHDPCYLGRYSNEFDAPRAVVAAAGASLVEMARNRTASACCGGGGGHAFMATAGSARRVNQLRAEQAQATAAETLAVSCPFCLRMLEDGVGSLDGARPQVRDIAELLLDRVRAPMPAPATQPAGTLPAVPPPLAT